MKRKVHVAVADDRPSNDLVANRRQDKTANPPAGASVRHRQIRSVLLQVQSKQRMRRLTPNQRHCLCKKLLHMRRPATVSPVIPGRSRLFAPSSGQSASGPSARLPARQSLAARPRWRSSERFAGVLEILVRTERSRAIAGSRHRKTSPHAGAVSSPVGIRQPYSKQSLLGAAAAIVAHAAPRRLIAVNRQRSSFVFWDEPTEVGGLRAGRGSRSTRAVKSRNTAVNQVRTETLILVSQR